MADLSQLSLEHGREEKLQQAQTSATKSPQSSRGQMGAHDITHRFAAAASALDTGQLVKDEYFTLFEAVGALEIMDPKMDSGYLTSNETLEDDYDILRILSPEEVVGIVDQMLCFEMAWHMGHPLSQSLFTSLYLDRLLWPEPKSLEQARFDRREIQEGNAMLHRVLRAYCLGLIKTCDFVHRRISTEHYYEEEDFVANLFHRSLLTRFDSIDIAMIMEDAITYIKKGSDFSDRDRNLRDALVNRLELRRSLMSAVDLAEAVDSQRGDRWERCLELLPALVISTKLGKPVENSFSAKIQRRLASSVPPRPIVTIGFDDAIPFLTNLCHYGKDAYRILNYYGGTHLMTFVWNYQSRAPQPSVYMRSLLQSLIFSEMKALGNLSIKQFLFDDLEEIVLPADPLLDSSYGDVEPPQDPRFRLAKRMDDFVTRVADPFIDIFRTLCMNRSRLRRMLCHLVVDWDSVQYDAEGFDADLRVLTKEEPIKDLKNSGEEIWSFPLSSWAYYHKLRQMEWIIQMGFELEIYQADELGGMYRYLQHLANTRIQHLERIRTFTTRRLTQIVKPTADERVAFRRSLSFLDFAMLEASATQSFADGLSCLYSFLSHIGLIPPPYHPMPYSSPSLRYTLRMRPFLSMSLPELPSYKEFISLVTLRTFDPNISDKPQPNNAQLNAQASSILDVADQALKIARKEWEAISKASAETARCQGCEDWWMDSVKNVLRACITANIMVATARKALAGAGERSAKEVVSVEVGGNAKGYHAWWIVPKISAR